MMSEVERHTLGTLPRFSVPDPITFTFQNAEGSPRDLTGYSFRVIIRKPNGTVLAEPTRTGVLDGDVSSGKAKYTFLAEDFDTANVEDKGLKVQMIAEKIENEEVLRRHISDIAVINIEDTPASAGYEPQE